MAHMPDRSNTSHNHHPAGMTEPRRDQLIAGASALLASLAIHAVLVFGGYLVFTCCFGTQIEQTEGILFAARLEPLSEQFKAYELQDTLEAEDLLKATMDTSEILKLDPSELDAPIQLPNMGEGNTKIDTVKAGIGLDASDALVGRPEDLASPLGEGFGRSRGAVDILGGASGSGSATSLSDTELRERFKYKELLLVWLVDSSPSLLDQIEMLKGQIDPLYARMNEYSHGRVYMTVMSYSEKAKLLLEKPTTDPAAVIAALDTIKKKGRKRFKEIALKRYANPKARITPARENTMRALREAVTLKGGKGRQIVIALLTDERGDDAGDWPKALKALQAKKIPLYVFGPTTRLPSEERDELLVIQDKAFITDKATNPHGYALVEGKGNLGSAESGREPFCRTWGAALPDGNLLKQPAVAGPFELSAIAKSTGGRYYFIEDGDVTDEATRARLPADGQRSVNRVSAERKQYYSTKNKQFDLQIMGEYMPEYSPEARSKFMSSFGGRFRDIVVDFEKIPKPTSTISKRGQLKETGRTVASNITAINRTIKRVNSLKAGPDVPRRWLAHRDLFLAQLHVARYNLRDYLIALEKASARKPSKAFMPLRLQQEKLDTPSTDLAITDTSDILTIEPVCTVIRSKAGFDEFLKDKSALGENQEIPQVNFSKDMLVVASLGRVYSPEAEIEILFVTQTQATLEVAFREILTETKPEDPDRPYFPCHAVIVRRSELPPKFVTPKEWRASRIAEEGPLLKGGKISAEYRQDAKIAVRRVLSRHKGTPWAKIAQGISMLGTFNLQEDVKKPPSTGKDPTSGKKPTSKETPSVPTVPGDF